MNDDQPLLSSINIYWYHYLTILNHSQLGTPTISNHNSVGRPGSWCWKHGSGGVHGSSSLGQAAAKQFIDRHLLGINQLPINDPKMIVADPQESVR